MAIVAGDLLYKHTGAASHNASQSDPDACLGNYRASENVGAGDNNLFDDVSGAESGAGDTEYRAVGFLNNHGSLTLTSIKAWIQVDTGNAEDDISFDVEVPAVSETTGAIQTIANESTAPTGLGGWSDATSKATGKAAPGGGGDLAFGEWFGLWVRRIISAAASAAAAESVTFRIEGDTPA
ncbi:hypothetical protein LCGC14_0483000 [marine sediment metagenome]|uniref:Uncharacterized protein n=1 Tax=marine sediment metagenome TaxID=412755 RepID=A0A0F9SS18_9ZZZZ